jgi:hypothetical protein
MLLAQAGEFAGAADPLHRRVQPQRHQDARVSRRMARPTRHRLDLRIQRRQIQPLHETPHQAHPVIGRNQFVQADRPQLHLPPFRHAKPRPPAARKRRQRLLGQVVEQSRGHHPIQSSWKENTVITITRRESGDSPRKIHRL